MLNQSIEELRTFVNNYRISNNDETFAKNGTTKHYSNDELIKLLESDTEETQHCTKKTLENNFKNQNGFNVLKVTKNNVEGLTLEIRESLYSKLNSSLSSNYKTTISKQSRIILTETDICDIAKKIEFSILSISKDLNSYKLSGTDKVVNIEKQTVNRDVCEALKAEIELLKLRDKMQRTMNENNSQELLSVLPVDVESISCREAQFQDDLFSAEPMTIEIGGDKSVNPPVLCDTATSESEYFSCSPIETQQNSESCVQESTKNEEFESVSTNDSVSLCSSNNYFGKDTTGPGDVLSEMHSSNGKDKIDLSLSIDEVSLNKNRKRKRNLEASTICLPIDDNKNNNNLLNHLGNVPDTHVENSSPNKKCKFVKSKTILYASNINIYAGKNNVETSETHLKDCSQVTLDKNQNENINAKKTDVSAANETTQIANIKLEPEDIKIEPISPTLTDSSRSYHNKEKNSLENSSTNEMLHEKPDTLCYNEYIISPDGKKLLQNKINQSEIISPVKFASVNSRCRIKSALDISCYSIRTDINKENFHESIYEKIVLHDEIVSMVDDDISGAPVDDITLQNSKLNFENDATSSLDTSTDRRKKKESTVVGEISDPKVDANKDHHENNIVHERTCLIDEEVFDRERARLDKEWEKIKNQNIKKSIKERETGFYIHGEYIHIFEIIIPIMRKYYPSQLIPDELCYGKILQRLQIDLADAEMSDDDIASYTRDSIETMRYLCDHCIVQ